jgi:hypothetical protein
MLKWLKRNVDSRPLEDKGIIENIMYNSMSGGQKNLSIGPALKYVSALTAKTAINKGDQLFIFNAGALAYVTMGGDSLAAAGSAPGPDTFPCQPGVFTVYSAADYTNIIGGADLHLYVLRDESKTRKDISGR